MKTMLAAPDLQMGEGTLAPDWQSQPVSTFDIDNSGLQPAWTQLLRPVQRLNVAWTARSRRHASRRSRLSDARGDTATGAIARFRCICIKIAGLLTPPVKRFAPTALMFGNIVTGCSVLAPAGMLSELSSDLGVSVARRRHC